MNMSMPLRYNISDWHRLPECKSNNSRLLSISVSDFINDKRLSGIRISIEHQYLGTLFAYVICAKGDIIDDIDGDYLPELSTKQLLTELAKYGFYITYNQRAHLSGTQLDYLMTLSGLGYDKLRILSTYSYINGIKQFSSKVIVFNSPKNPDWLNLAYSPSELELLAAFNSGSAINISAISRSKEFSWAWLDYVADIQDILEDNKYASEE